MLGITLHAQEGNTLRPTRHGALWLGAGTELKPFKKRDGAITERAFNKNFSLTGEVGWRAALDPFVTKQAYVSASARYRVSDLWRVGTEYRWSFRDPTRTNTGRLDLQSWLRWKTGRIRLDHRFQYEHDFIAITKVRSTLRNRLGVEYNIPKWKLDPHASAELFTGLHYTGNRNIGIRYELGTELVLDKSKDRVVGLAMRYDTELNTVRPQNTWILVISFEQDFKKK